MKKNIKKNRVSRQFTYEQKLIERSSKFLNPFMGSIDAHKEFITFLNRAIETESKIVNGPLAAKRVKRIADQEALWKRLNFLYDRKSEPLISGSELEKCEEEISDLMRKMGTFSDDLKYYHERFTALSRAETLARWINLKITFLNTIGEEVLNDPRLISLN